MRLTFEPSGWDDYLYWQTNDKAMLCNLNRLIEECLRHPLKSLPEKKLSDIIAL
jgi:toxin YoeB